MKETVIIGIDRRGRKVTSFGTAVEAAEKLGVTRQAVGQAVKKEGMCGGLYLKRVPRLFVVRGGGETAVCLRSGEWYEEVKGDRRFGAEGNDLVADVTEAVWKASLARDL